MAARAEGVAREAEASAAAALATERGTASEGAAGGAAAGGAGGAAGAAGGAAAGVAAGAAGVAAGAAGGAAAGVAAGAAGGAAAGAAPSRPHRSEGSCRKNRMWPARTPLVAGCCCDDMRPNWAAMRARLASVMWSPSTTRRRALCVMNSSRTRACGRMRRRVSMLAKLV